MFNSSVIDVAIGLVFVFLLLSLVASSAKEGLEAIFKRRASDLERGIKELIGSDGGELVAAIYDHGLVNSLFVGTYGDKKAVLPSYIPAKNFALALMDIRKKYQSAATPIALPVHVKQAFDAFEITAGKDENKMQKQIEDWYNGSMDRVSGWYKRRTQTWIFCIGLLITIVVNADTVQIAKRLSTDATLREGVVKAAQQESRSNPVAAGDQISSASAGQASPASAGQASPASADQASSAAATTSDDSIQKIKSDLAALDGVGLPIGWTDDLKNWHAETAKIGEDTGFADKVKIYSGATWNLRVEAYPHLAGWLLTALAISLGAPFWFDMLNKIMVIRSTVKPSEKSKEESSKDPVVPSTTITPPQ